MCKGGWGRIEGKRVVKRGRGLVGGGRSRRRGRGRKRGNGEEV